MDGLLLTRAERLRGFGEKVGLVAGPSAVLALVLLALGFWADAIFVAVVAGLTAVSLGPVVSTRRGAALCGLLTAGVLVGLLLFSAYIVSHPAPS